MTYIEWERELIKSLKNLSPKEKNEAINYYKEMYRDKRDAGLSDDEIIKTFGEPWLCAAKIMAENELTDEEIAAETADKASDEVHESQKKAKEKLTASKIIGFFFLTVLFIIPLVSTVFSVLISLAAVTLSCAAVAIAGAILALTSPILFFIGYSLTGVIATFGAALVAFGVGVVLFDVFYVITKYASISCYKLFKHFLIREVGK